MAELIFGIVGLITGCLGVIISILSYRHNKIDALNNYFTYDRDIDFIKGRNIANNLKEKIAEDENYYISLVVNTYHHWGLLVKHHQLPFWVFYDKKYGITASGIAIIKNYKKLEHLISERRKDNREYACYFSWLYKKVYNNCNNEEKGYIDNLIKQ